MTVQDTAVFVDYVGDDAQTSFDFTFRCDDVSFLSTSFTDDFDQFVLHANQDNNPGGSAEYLVAPPLGQNFQVIRDTPDTQELDYTRYDAFDSESHEDALDKLTMLIQELQNQIDGFSSGNILALGTVEGSIFRWNVAGQSWDEFIAYILPAADGTLNQVMVTDGVGGMTFATQAGQAVSTQADSVLRGDGSGGFIEETEVNIDSDGNILSFDNEIRRPSFIDYAVRANMPTISGNEVTVDLEIANAVYIDIAEASGDFDVILINPPAFDNYGEVVIDFIQSAGDHNAIWENKVRWPGGTAPVLSSGSMNRDTVHLWTRDAGITWFGSFLQDYGAIGGGGAPVAELDDLPVFIESELIDGTFFVPICAVRTQSNGELQTATGSTEALLNFSQEGNDWLIAGLNSEFETEWIETSRSGAAGTLFGTTLVGFTSNIANQSQAWEKNTNSVGIATIELTIEIREIANPGNTTGPQPIEMECRIEA